jgi:hypothetical protein
VPPNATTGYWTKSTNYGVYGYITDTQMERERKEEKNDLTYSLINNFSFFYNSQNSQIKKQNFSGLSYTQVNFGQSK